MQRKNVNETNLEEQKQQRQTKNHRKYLCAFSFAMLPWYTVEQGKFLIVIVVFSSIQF